MLYEITVKGALDATWSDWYGGMTISVQTRQDGHTLTTLTGWMDDQAALRGLINRLWDLNLTLVSVSCSEAREESHGGK